MRRRAGGAPAARGSLARRDADTHARGDSIPDGCCDALADAARNALAYADRNALTHADADRDTLTPTATATPSPTPTATPAPTPTATPAPLITAEDLGIREVDTAEALAAAGLTHVRYPAGEEAPWDPGLFLLDVESGEVESWVRSLAALSEEERYEARRASDDLDVSPSNRFVSWAGHGMLYDRHTGRTYELDSSAVEFDRWWGTGPGERLLFRLAAPARSWRWTPICGPWRGSSFHRESASPAPTAATSSSASASNVSRATASTS